jgi:hypothetical protein
MFELDFIQQLVKEKVEISKSSVTATDVIYNKLFSKEIQEKYPEYWDGYKEAVSMLDAIRVHAEYGITPDVLLEKRSPNETNSELQYRKNNYRQTTLQVFKDFESTVQRAFHDTNWTLTYNEDSEAFKDDSFQKYVEQELPIYGSLENFVKFVLPTIKLKDANGVIAIKPVNLEYKLNSNNEPVLDGDALVTPTVFYYDTKRVLAYEKDKYALVETYEKSKVEYGGKLQNIGRVFEFYDNENIWIIKQSGKYIDYTFEYYLYFNHDTGVLPVHDLMGVPYYRSGKILWKSPFLFAVPNLDTCLLDESNITAVKASSVYPYKVMIGNICEFEDRSGNRCIDGIIVNEDGKQYTCPSCNGSGLKNRMSPLGVMLLKPKTALSDSELQYNGDPLKYVSPSIETIEFLRREVKEHEQRARRILHLQTADSGVNFDKSNETATGSDNNLKSLYAFLKPISDQIFTLYEWSLNTIGVMRYGKSYSGVNLIYPQSFDFKTSEDYLNEINEAVKVGLPPIVVHTLIYNFLKATFYAEGKVSKAFDLIVEIDRLLPFTNEEIALKLSRNTIEKWEEILHSSAYTFIAELEKEDENFWRLDFEVQKQRLIEKAKSRADEMPKIQTGMIDLDI